jgi:hypothetical protein
VGRPAQRTRGSVPENQFRRPRPGLHGGRLTEILEPLPEPRETSTAPAREDEHRAAGSPGTRPRWTEIRSDRAPHRRTSEARSTGEPRYGAEKGSGCTRSAMDLGQVSNSLQSAAARNAASLLPFLFAAATPSPSALIALLFHVLSHACQPAGLGCSAFWAL